VSKKKRQIQRLAQQTAAILGDVDTIEEAEALRCDLPCETMLASVARKDVGIQVTLCSCVLSDRMVMAESKYRDACEQVSLCCCSEFVSHDGSSDACREPCALAMLGPSLPEAARNSEIFLKASAVEKVSNVGLGDLPDTYVNDPLPVLEKTDNQFSNIVNSTSNQLPMEPSDIGRSKATLSSDSIKKRARNAQLDALVDDVIESMHNVSLHTSVVQTIPYIAAAVDQPETAISNPLSSLDDTELYSLSPANENAEVVHFSDNLFPDGFKWTVGSALSGISDDSKLVDDVFELGHAVVHEATEVQTIEVPSVPKATVLVLDEASDKEMNGMKADILSDESVSETKDPNSPFLHIRNKSGHANAYEFTEVETGMTSDVLKNTFLVSDDAAGCERDLSAHGMAANSSDVSNREPTSHGTDSPQDDSGHAARKILTSTVIGSPDTISNFFGLVRSSLSGSGQSPKYATDGRRRKSKLSPKHSTDGKRRKSKHGRRRVSMCGEYDAESPEFLTPFRMPAAIGTELMTIVDTDEGKENTAPSSRFYSTALEGLVLDTESENDEEDCNVELIKEAAAVDGCVPDSPIDGGEPVENIYFFDVSLSERSLESDKRASLTKSISKPTLDGQSADVESESVDAVRLHCAIDADSRSHVEETEHSLATLEPSVGDIQNKSHILHDDPLDDEDDFLFDKAIARNHAAETRRR